MGIIQRLTAWLMKMSSADLFAEVYGSKKSLSGRTVTVNTAFQVSTVIACVRCIAEGVAQVPLKLMRFDAAARLRYPDFEHPLYSLLYLKPNSWQTSFEFRETFMLHLLMGGDAFIFVSRGLGGKILELIPLDPTKIEVKRSNSGVMTYVLTAENGAKQTFPAEVIWHLRGPSWNSYLGLPIMDLAREAIGLAISTEERHARMHSNGINTRGIYSIEGKLDVEQHKQLQKWLRDNYTGDGAESPMILDRAAKWTPTEMTGVDAQHLETRRYQVEEICRFFRVMPIMVGYSDKASTYASAEQMFLAHLVHTLAPWYQRIEQSADANLLTDKDRASGLYVSFVEEGLLRGSSEATATVIEKYVNGGLMTPNEGRAKLDLNPDTDPASDKLRVPANIVGAQPAQGATNAA